MAITRITFGEWTPDQPGVSGNLQKAENVYSKLIGYGSIQGTADYSQSASENLTNVVAGRSETGATLVFAGGETSLFKLDASDLSLDNVSAGYQTITTVARTSNVVTITTAAAHGFTTGDDVTITASPTTGVNGTFQITGTPTTTTFTYAQTGTDIPSTANTGTAFVKYETPSGQRWRFTQFGNVIIGANGHSKLQKFNLNTDTKFAKLSNDAPEARYVTVVRDFVVSAWINSTTLRPYRVQWSALGDETSWATSATTQADFQDIPDGGAIVGITGGEFGLVLMDRSIHRMSYIGSPLVFQFDNISRNLGCYESNSIIQYQGTTFFLSDDGFYSCDGQTVFGIGNEKINRYFYSDVDEGALDKMSAAVDPGKKLIVWAYQSKSSATVDKLLIYNFQTQKWSSGTTDASRVASSSTPSFDLEGLDIFGNLDQIGTPLDSRIWLGGKLEFAGVKNAKIVTFSGSTNQAIIETGDIEIPGKLSAVTLAEPIVDNGSGSVALISRKLLNEQIDFEAATSVAANSENRVSIRGVGRYHRLQLKPSGNWKNVFGMDIDINQMGSR
jgi:hypothetical protein